jgi:hypothetical protein
VTEPVKAAAVRIDDPRTWPLRFAPLRAKVLPLVRRRADGFPDLGFLVEAEAATEVSIPIVWLGEWEEGLGRWATAKRRPPMLHYPSLDALTQGGWAID